MSATPQAASGGVKQGRGIVKQVCF